jgi:hypothetical protein
MLFLGDEPFRSDDSNRFGPVGRLLVRAHMSDFYLGLFGFDQRQTRIYYLAVRSVRPSTQAAFSSQQLRC